MRVNSCRLSMAACASGLVLSLTALSCPRLLAQETGRSDQVSDLANKKIDLDLESTNLYYGLKLLFSQVKANFTIDESLKSLTVTAHLTQVPFRVALETLLKSTGTPLTYKVESGIYSVVPKVEEPEPTLVEPARPEPASTSGGYRYGIIHPTNLSAIDIVQAFGGHVVNVGYNPQSYGMGGMGGLGGQVGGLGGVGTNFGGLGGGVGGYGSNYGSGYGGSNYGGYGGGLGYNYGAGGDSGYRPGVSNPGVGSGGSSGRPYNP